MLDLAAGPGRGVVCESPWGRKATILDTARRTLSNAPALCRRPSQTRRPRTPGDTCPPRSGVARGSSIRQVVHRSQTVDRSWSTIRSPSRMRRHGQGRYLPCAAWMDSDSARPATGPELVRSGRSKRSRPSLAKTIGCGVQRFLAHVRATPWYRLSPCSHIDRDDRPAFDEHDGGDARRFVWPDDRHLPRFGHGWHRMRWCPRCSPTRVFTSCQ